MVGIWHHCLGRTDEWWCTLLLSEGVAGEFTHNTLLLLAGTEEHGMDDDVVASQQQPTMRKLVDYDAAAVLRTRMIQPRISQLRSFDSRAGRLTTSPSVRWR